MVVSYHGSLLGSKKRLSRSPVSAKVETEVCNSIHLDAPIGQTIGQYADKWYKDGKSKVSCVYHFVTQNGEPIDVTASICRDSKGIFDQSLWLEPFNVKGKKIWVETRAFSTMYKQACNAHMRLCNPGK